MRPLDEKLVQQTLAGDAESFSELVRKYQGAVQGLAYHLVGSFEDAEDLVQEAFVTAYLKLHQLRQPEKFAMWIRQITHNCCMMWLRSRRENVSIDEATADCYVDRQSPSPAEVYERKEMRELVRRALNQLTEKNRLAVTLYYIDGLSYKDIANFLDVPVTTVEGRIHRAKKQLKRRFEMVEDTLRNEKLSDDFTRKVVEEALKKAKGAREGWAKGTFVNSCREAMEALDKFDDVHEQMRTRIEVLSMLGDAGMTWLGQPEQAIQNYESALALARKHNDTSEAAKVLKAMFIAHCRRGEYDRLRERAQEALPLFSELRDWKNKALTQAALDLVDGLPGTWGPGQVGGYVMAAFPIEATEEGYAFLEPESVRNYSWGCPSRCTALTHLLTPLRFLGPALHAGASYEDTISHLSRYGLGWRLPEDAELIAKSTVESNNDTVVTPAGRFEGCLRVKTVITPPDGNAAGEFATRSYCGTRMTWFAPGVGLVKLRHEDQNEIVWSVYLVGQAASLSETGKAARSTLIGNYFPLAQGQTWRYRWMTHGYPPSLFEDICRVVAVDGNTAYLSSTTWGGEPSEADALRYFEEMLELEVQSGDLAGEAATIEQIVRRLGEDEQNRKLTYRERLVSIYETLGDAWKLLNARWYLAFATKKLTSDEQFQCEEEKLELARQHKDRVREAQVLWTMANHYRESGEVERSIQLLEDAANIYAALGDAENTARYISWSEWTKQTHQGPTPSLPVDFRSVGRAGIMTKDGKLCPANSSRAIMSDKGFPRADAKGSPMADFFAHGPFMGIKLLSEKVDHSCTDFINTGVPGLTSGEHMRTTSTLVSKTESVTVPAGEFSGCALIETVVSTSDEAKPDESERSFYQGYWAGTCRAWFAPGVGLVRFLYQHRNGHETDIQLMEYTLAEPSSDYLPLALNNRWRYRWVDAQTNVVFEDALRVATHGGKEWHIAFVTCANVYTLSPESEGCRSKNSGSPR